jgi:hypothetical protein
VLFPLARRRLDQHVPGVGTVLRWVAALEAMERFSGFAGDAAGILHRRVAAIARAIEANSALVPIGGLADNGSHWADGPSIVTFGVRDGGRLLSVAELKPMHERLARGGVLLGQPISLGAFGGLRVAVGARDVVQGALGAADRLLEAIGGLRHEPAARLAVAAE